MKTLLKLIVPAIILLGSFQLVHAQTNKNANASGNWNIASNWTTSGVPTSSNDVTIPAGITMTLNQDASINNLTVLGTLIFESGNSRTLTVNGNVSIGNNGTLSTNTSGSSSTTHTIDVKGNFENSGTFNGHASGSNTYLTNITITGSSASTITLGSNSTTDFSVLTINKSTKTTQVTFSPGGTITDEGQAISNSGFLTLTRGSFTLSGNNNFSSPLFTSTTVLINGNSVFTLNNVNATITGLNGNVELENSGELNITNGTFHVGTTSSRFLDIKHNDGKLNVQGGRLIIAGRQVFSKGSITISGGEMVVANTGNTSSNLTFDITGGTFTQSGGTITLANSGTSVDLNLSSADLTNVSGGTIKLGTSAITANTVFDIQGAVYGLTFESGKNITARQTGSLSITNNLDLANGTVKIDGQTLTIAGSITSPSANPIISSTTSNITFSGSGNVSFALSQATDNSTNEIRTLTINRNGAIVTMLSNVKINKDIILTSGKLNIDTSTLTLKERLGPGTLVIITSATNSLRGGELANLILEMDASRTIWFDQTVDSSTNMLNNVTVNTASASNVFRPGNKVVIKNLTLTRGQINLQGATAVIGNITGATSTNFLTNTTSNITFLGGTIPGGITLTSLNVNSPGTTTSIAADVAVTNVNIIAGTLSANGRNITFNTWINNGGNFDGTGAKVIASGNASISGSVKTDFTAIEIPSGATLTVNSNISASSITLLAGTTANSLNIGLNDTVVVGTVTLNQPTASITTAINVDNGVLISNGLISLGGTNTTTSRVSRIRILNGSLIVNAGLTILGTTKANKIIDMSGGAGRLSLAGTITGAANATLTTGTADNTVVFAERNNAQTFFQFGGTDTYNNIEFANTSANGASINANINTNIVKGNVTISAGTFRNNGFHMMDGGSKTFSIRNGATFINTHDHFPAFGSYSLEANSTVEYGYAGALTSLIKNITYGNVIVSGGITKSLEGSTTIAGTLTVNSGKLAVGSNTLTLNGGFSGSATNCISSNGNSNLTFGGTGNIVNFFVDQATNGTTNKFNALTYNRSGATITLANRLQIAQAVVPTAGTLNSNGNLELLSDNTTDARIGPGTGNYIIGNVIVNRYVPSVVRRWRFFSPGVKNFTFNQFIDDMFLSGPGGTTNGFDQSSNNSPSLYTYQESTVGGRGWKTVSNINNSLVAGRGVMVFVRGDRSITGWFTAPFPAQNQVMVDFTGEVNTGDVSPALTYTNTGLADNDGWNLVGNPYPSPINWANVTKSNLSQFYYVYNPQSGSYVARSGSQEIASGQAFFVQAVAANPTLTFTESCKSVGNPNKYFKTSKLAQSLYVKMVRDSVNMDEAWINLKPGNSNTFVNNEDAPKFYNSLINLSVLTSDNKEVQINNAQPIISNDTFYLNTQAGANGTYQLNIDPSNIIATVGVFLIDRKLNTITNLRQQNTVSFTIANNDTTTFKRRFAVVFTANGTLPVTYKSFNATAKNNNVQLTWETASEKNSSHFEIERSIDGTNYETIGNIKAAGNSNTVKSYVALDKEILAQHNTVYYRLKQVDFDQKFEYSKVVTVSVENNSNEPVLYPVPAQNYISLKANNMISAKVMDVTGKVMEVNQVNNANEITFDLSNLSEGMYFMVIETQDGLVKKNFIKN
ncbi:MAG: T9SS type A sorting domain-containing protein [Bacteroidota bacterium]